MPKLTCPACGHGCWVESRLFTIVKCPQCEDPFVVSERDGELVAQPALCTGCGKDTHPDQLSQRWDSGYGWGLLCQECQEEWDREFPTMTLEGAVARLREDNGLPKWRA